MSPVEAQILFVLLDRVLAFSDKVKQAKAEGRTLTKAELDEFERQYEESDFELSEAIAQARDQG